MKLLYGTTNQAKLESMKRVTKILGLEIFGLNELKEMPEFANVVLPEIDETGSNPLENATLKAKAYFNTLKILVFSRMDSSLEIEPFYLVSKPHPKIVSGFPLDALSIQIESGKYFQDLEHNLAVDKNAVENGFAKFFRDVLKI